MDTKTREVVLTTLLDIEKNHTFSNIALGTALRANQFMSKQDRAYITRMVEGVTEKKNVRIRNGGCVVGGALWYSRIYELQREILQESEL